VAQSPFALCWTAAMQTLSAARARRLALGATGLAAARPRGRVDRRHVHRVFERNGLLQIDSVNVLVRAQEMPLFTRLGPHSRDLLPRLVADKKLFEYWGHEASLIPVEHQPLLRWRMEEARHGAGWAGLADLQRRRPDYIEAIYQLVVERGPITAAQLDPSRSRNEPWWGWHDAKRALEVLFWCGRITASRGTNFARIYDLPERVLPASVLAMPTPDEADAIRKLLLIAARALGVATVADLADYWRVKVPRARPLVAELVEEGELLAVRVEGWRDVAYVSPGAVIPRRVDARALVSPFDPIMWERKRLERLFGFEYRIEIYVPAPKRKFGYYVLPFVYGDRFVARVDLRADRKRSALVVASSHPEPYVTDDALHALAAELRLLATWLGLDRIKVEPRGDLARALRNAVASGAAR
jgi:uncharacterized protein